MTLRLVFAKRDVRVVVGGLFVIAMILVAGRMIPAILSSQRIARQSLGELRHEVARLESTVRNTRAVADSARARRQRLDSLSKLLVSGRTVHEAIASLTGLVVHYADAAGVRLLSQTIRSDTGFVAGMAMVDLRLSAVTDVQGLAGFLRRVEGGSRLLIIRQLSVIQPEPGASETHPEALQLDLSIQALATWVSSEEARR